MCCVQSNCFSGDGSGNDELRPSAVTNCGRYECKHLYGRLGGVGKSQSHCEGTCDLLYRFSGIFDRVSYCIAMVLFGTRIHSEWTERLVLEWKYWTLWERRGAQHERRGVARTHPNGIWTRRGQQHPSRTAKPSAPVSPSSGCMAYSCATPTHCTILLPLVIHTFVYPVWIVYFTDVQGLGLYMYVSFRSEIDILTKHCSSAPAITSAAAVAPGCPAHRRPDFKCSARALLHCNVINDTFPSGSETVRLRLYRRQAAVTQGIHEIGECLIWCEPRALPALLPRPAGVSSERRYQKGVLGGRVAVTPPASCKAGGYPPDTDTAITYPAYATFLAAS